jgi:integrase
MAAKRPHGSGSLYLRADATGREIYYGHWRRDGQQIKRRIGPKRPRGTRDGLTQLQAAKEPRWLMEEERPTRHAGDALIIPELGRLYLAELESQARKKATVTAVESILRVWLEPFFGDRDLRKINVEEVNDLIRTMKGGSRPGPRRSGDRRYGRSVGVKSIRNYIGTLSALLNFAVREKLVAANVSRHAKLPRAARDEDIRFLGLDEVNALVAAVQPGPYESIDRALYLTAAMTGLRQGELIALRWLDVDWPSARVRVRQNFVLGEFGTPKSRRSTRSVPLADAVAGELARLNQVRVEHRDDQLVFADPHGGGPLDRAAILRRYRKALKAAHLDETHRFHDLRHTFGTRMAAAGVPMRTLQEWMGHRNIDTTQRYADYAPSAHEAAFVESAFAPERTTSVAVPPRP